MLPESLVLGQVLAPIVSGIVVVILYHYIGRRWLGADENRLWNRLRRTVLGSGDSFVRKKTDFALTNTAHNEEFVGSYDMSSDELAEKLEENGYLQCVLSGLKKRGDPSEYEVGSMAYRESASSLVPDALAMKQTHIFWFENEDGTVDVYAHHEFSSLNPLVAWKHYRAVGQEYETGINEAKEILE